MLRIVFALLLTVLASVTWAQETYRLGPGDSITISVYDEPDLKMSLKISKSGILSFPFLEEFVVIGLTSEQLAKKIDTGLRGDYLINPQVNVSIDKYRPFFIHGAVVRPGGYPYQPDLTLDKAIALAGGLTNRASGSNWTVTRVNSGVQEVLNGNVNTAIMPDDIIKIEQSFF